MTATSGEMDRLIRESAQQAFDSLNTSSEDTGAPPEVPASPANESVEPVPTGSQSESGSTEGSQEPTVDMSPYFGINPDGIPAEKWSEILNHLKRQDSTIGRLNQRLASRRRLESIEDAPVREAARESVGEVLAERQPATTSESQSPPLTPADVESVQSLDVSKVSDQDFVRALGFEPEEMEESVVKAVGMLARDMLEAKKQAAEATSRIEEDEAVKFWNASLDELEVQFGKFPADWDRESVLQFAVDEGIASPYELYFRLTARARSEVEAAANEARRAALVEKLKQEQAGGLRPASSAAGDEPDITEKTDLRKAVEQSIRAAEQKHGTSIVDAVRARLNRQE